MGAVILKLFMQKSVLSMFPHCSIVSFAYHPPKRSKLMLELYAVPFPRFVVLISVIKLSFSYNPILFNVKFDGWAVILTLIFAASVIKPAVSLPVLLFHVALQERL